MTFYLFFLNTVKNLGSWRIRNILRHFRSLDELLRCSPERIRCVEGIDAVICGSILEACAKVSSSKRDYDQLLEILEKKKIKVSTMLDNDYPENLKVQSTSPVILYYKGSLSHIDRYSLSIVGTRIPTEYGKHSCEKFTSEISALGIPVISGFARGIDTIAHTTSLKRGNLTYAVFGNGLDVIYPAENRRLYDEIVECGAVISEFVPGTKPDRTNFPRRNRIISGISLGTLVVESSISGGAVLTADLAVEQNKEVFAVPGFIHSRQSEGTNELIKRGQAKLVTCVDDIIEELERKLAPLIGGQLSLEEKQPEIHLAGPERKVFDVIGTEPVHIDALSELSGCSVSECLVHLLTLEFRNIVKQLPGKYFARF